MEKMLNNGINGREVEIGEEAISGIVYIEEKNNEVVIMEYGWAECIIRIMDRWLKEKEVNNRIKIEYYEELLKDMVMLYRDSNLMKDRIEYDGEIGKDGWYMRELMDRIIEYRKNGMKVEWCMES